MKQFSKRLFINRIVIYCISVLGGMKIGLLNPDNNFYNNISYLLLEYEQFLLKDKSLVVQSPRPSDSDSSDSGGRSGDEADCRSRSSLTPPPRLSGQLPGLPPNMTSVDVGLIMTALTGGNQHGVPSGAPPLPFYAPPGLLQNWSVLLHQFRRF